MGIITRAYHVGRSYVNSVVAWMASLDRTLQLLVQDMEEVPQKARSSAAKAIVERKHLERRVAVLKSEIEAWRQRTEVAVLNDRDDLATEVLQAKARCAAMLVSAEAQLSSVSAVLVRHEEDMERRQVRLDEARASERALRSLRRTAESRILIVISDGAPAGSGTLSVSNSVGNLSVETMGRYKTLIRSRLRARGFAAQQTEAAIGVMVLNRMLAAGRPDSVRRQPVTA
jgi:PspA/IM30 family